jgi:hypothetical protein
MLRTPLKSLAFHISSSFTGCTTKCLICRAADPAPGRGRATEVPILSLTDQAVKLIEKERRVGFPSKKN